MKKLYLYPLWIRIWHWINVLLFLVLIATGLLIHYTPDGIGVINFKSAILIHNVAGLWLSLWFCFFVVGNLFGKNRVHYKVRFKGLPTRLYLQTVYYAYGIFRGAPHPFLATEKCKFNALQQLSYLGVMAGLLPPLIVTGLVLLAPLPFTQLIGNPSSIIWVAVIHSVLAFLATLFMIVHAYIATTGRTVTSNYQAMFTGWHTEPEE